MTTEATPRTPRVNEQRNMHRSNMQTYQYDHL
jgi:hypothetical protein